MRAKMCSQTRVKVKNGSQTANCISQTRKKVKNGSQMANCISQTRVNGRMVDITAM